MGGRASRGAAAELLAAGSRRARLRPPKRAGIQNFQITLQYGPSVVPRERRDVVVSGEVGEFMVIETNTDKGRCRESWR